MPSFLTVANLISDPTLDTRVLAGSNGLGRTVRWAQTSESPTPWRWLGDDELLMTLGINLPADPTAQAAFVRRAHQAGIAGMTIGEDGLAPPLSEQMFTTANELAFPILSTGPDTPFVVIARSVAAITTNELNRSVLVLSRLYQVAGNQSREERRRGAWIEELTGAQLAVRDTKTSCLVIGEEPQGPVRPHSLQTIRPTQLLIPVEAQLDGLLLVHLRQILTVDANSLFQEAEKSVASGEGSLRLALEGRLAPSDIDEGQWLQRGETYRVACGDQKNLETLAMSMALYELVPLATSWKRRSILVVREQDQTPLAAILETTGALLGLSTPQHHFADLSGAADEARNAYESAKKQSGLVEFTGTQVSLLSRSRSEAEHIIRTVLGDLAADNEQIRVFRDSLFCLLAHDLKWKSAAAELNIHRQTLAYRIKQAESLCRRSVRKVADISELYLAQQAWQQVNAK